MDVSLYHSAMSTCSQKVRLALAEKAVDWTSHEVNLLASEQKSPLYLSLNSKGVVPTLVVDGMAIIESTLINEFINETFDGPTLLPRGAIDRAKARLWPKRLDEGVHAACGVLTFGTVMRTFQMMRPREEVLADILATQDPQHRAIRMSLFEQGVQAPAFGAAVETLTHFFAEMDESLGGTDWLGGEAFSLADCAAAPYVVRFDQLGLTEAWQSGQRPNLWRWYEALRARPSFETAIVRWQSEAAVKSFARAGREILPLLDA